MNKHTVLLTLALTLPGITLSLLSKSVHSVEPKALIAQGGATSKKQAMSAASRQVAGRVLSATLIKTAPRPHYKVRVLTNNGRVKTVRVHAAHGAK